MQPNSFTAAPSQWDHNGSGFDNGTVLEHSLSSSTSFAMTALLAFLLTSQVMLRKYIGMNINVDGAI
jgi:hypothetical protein